MQRFPYRRPQHCRRIRGSTDMKIERLRDMREDHDLTQKQLAEVLHISQRAYAHYELGTREIPIELLIRLADYYETSVDYLLSRTDKKKMVK